MSQVFARDIGFASPFRLSRFFPRVETRMTTTMKLTINVPHRNETAEIKTEGRPFEVRMTELASKFLAELDSTITNGKITALTASTGGVRIVWNPRFTKTAGRMKWRGERLYGKDENGQTKVEYRNYASIEVSKKVVTNEGRLYIVIAHEFCHIAAIMISGTERDSHGAVFRAWGRKVMSAFAARGIVVATRHNFDIDYGFQWACVRCGAEYKRHRDSIDVEKRCCRVCGGLLSRTKPPPPPPPTGKVSGYHGFFGTWFGRVRSGNPSMGNREAVGMLRRMYKEERRRKRIEAAAGRDPAGKTSVGISSKGEEEPTLKDEEETDLEEEEGLVLEEGGGGTIYVKNEA